jgi:hypothetical protein
MVRTLELPRIADHRATLKVPCVVGSPITCDRCGEEVPPDLATGRAPAMCPHCGSTSFADPLASGPMTPTNAFLDHFVARKLSELTQCGAPMLDGIRREWLNTFVLVTAFHNVADNWRPYVINYLRRADGALAAYDAGAAALTEYVTSPESSVSLYFRALLGFEVCIAQLCQSIQFQSSASANEIYIEDSGSTEERLFLLYNDQKNMDRFLGKGKGVAAAASSIWITNIGLESPRARLTFDELVATLRAMADFATQLAAAPPASDS